VPSAGPGEGAGVAGGGDGEGNGCVAPLCPGVLRPPEEDRDCASTAAA
jgi:hypothetical protein